MFVVVLAVSWAGKSHPGGFWPAGFFRLPIFCLLGLPDMIEMIIGVG